MIESRGRDVLFMWLARGFVAAAGVIMMAAAAGLAVRVFGIVSG